MKYINYKKNSAFLWVCPKKEKKLYHLPCYPKMFVLQLSSPHLMVLFHHHHGHSPGRTQKTVSLKMVETMSFNTEMVYITWMIWGNYIHFMNFDETPK